jgi:hypothetical protein
MAGGKRRRSPGPALPARTVSPPAAAAAAGAPLRCLLADDHALNLKLVKARADSVLACLYAPSLVRSALNPQRLLEQHGFSVTTAANGKEAFDALVKAYEAGAPPHIAIIDMQACALRV